MMSICDPFRGGGRVSLGGVRDGCWGKGKKLTVILDKYVHKYIWQGCM